MTRSPKLPSTLAAKRAAAPKGAGFVSRVAARWRAPRLAGFAASLGVLALAGGSSGSANQTHTVGERLHSLAVRARGDYSLAGFDAAFRGMDPAALALASRYLDQRDAAGLVAISLRNPGTSPDPAAGVPADALQALSWDSARVVNASVPFSATPNPPAAAFALPAAGEDREKAVDCLTQAVYYEAAYEPPQGQAAVAQVILNRLRHPLYPKTVCGVVYQGSSQNTGCQFTFTCDGSLARPPVEWAWKQARDVATRALDGYVERSVGYATHYHADYVVPYWAPSLSKVAKVGQHIFYRWPAGMGAPPMFSGRYAGGESIPGRASGAAEALLAAGPVPLAGSAAEPLVTRSQAEQVVQEPVVVASLDTPRAAPAQLDAPSAAKLSVAPPPRVGPRLAVPTGW